jgi:hypothetical protein
MAVIEAIATTYLEADAASVTFSGIPATYEHLQVRGNYKSAGPGTEWNDVTVQDASGGIGSNYSTHYMYADGTSKAAGSATGATKWNFPSATASGASEGSAWYGTIIVDILDYTNTNKNTTIMYTCGNSSGVNSLSFGSGLASDTDTIVQLTFGFASDNLLRGSVFTLYGLNSA